MAKKESFIKGTLILAAAALVARVLGLVQRVPLDHLFDDVGKASFTIANNVYLMLLTVATAGIPSTLSKMVSERYALKRPGEARQVYHAALLFAGFAGVIITVLLYILAPYYATYVSKVPDAALSIRALAPALLLFPAIAMMRGYFQGRNNMTAGGISQIVEQFARVGAAIIIAYILLKSGYDGSWVAAGASFGGVLGSIGAFAIMLYYTVKTRQQDKALMLQEGDGVKLPLMRIYKDIFTLSIPIVLSSLTVPAVNFIDSSIVNPLLIGQIGEAKATQVLGILGQRAQSIAGIPPILAIALSTSLIPVISAAFARKDQEHLQQQMTLALRISILTGMPIVIALCVAAYSINGLLFSSLDGSWIIMLLTFGTIFQITMMTTNSILLGVNKAKLSMVNVMIGILVKLAGSFALAFVFGIYGIIAATGLCFLVITLLNLRYLKVIVPFSILGKRWTGFLIAVILTAAVGYGLNEAGVQLTRILPDRLAFLITCIIVGGAVVVLYLVLLIMLGVLRQHELASYPRKLQRLLRPLMRLQPAKYKSADSERQ
ncbi:MULTISPECIES: putative polysaccharide biosynthesis protein [Paenibacillus]|uniref:Stage V sporulation protein B n=1 Tax=Paenibacillus albilobatus TaxID=2716884 RepID=A0A919XJ40_9BACL|nr:MULTISPECIES: polysaccharide biosynthesis protein [Paenibacillus]GIO33857.1 stage V sporulation protein B [Paenibacillus albilobatus]